MMASLNSAGKQPVVSDLLTNKAMKGESSSLMSLTSHVGTGSSWHVRCAADQFRNLVSGHSSELVRR